MLLSFKFSLMRSYTRGHVFFSGATRNDVLALKMGYHEMVEDVGDGIRKLAFSDGSSDNSPRLEKPAHSKRVFSVFFYRLFIDLNEGRIDRFN